MLHVAVHNPAAVPARHKDSLSTARDDAAFWSIVAQGFVSGQWKRKDSSADTDQILTFAVVSQRIN
jgi:hypothetical protein